MCHNMHLPSHMKSDMVHACVGYSTCNVSFTSCLPGMLVANRRQIELVQDLEFPAACHRVKATPDGQFLIATGTHAPRMRAYELSQLSMKFERHFDAEIIDFQVRI